jgi:hypothetical protein
MKAWKLFAGSRVLGSPLSFTLPAQTGTHQHPQAETKGRTVKDPVCGMNVVPYPNDSVRDRSWERHPYFAVAFGSPSLDSLTTCW